MLAKSSYNSLLAGVAKFVALAGGRGGYRRIFVKSTNDSAPFSHVLEPVKEAKNLCY